jgi:hypothetical protein
MLRGVLEPICLEIKVEEAIYPVKIQANSTVLALKYLMAQLLTIPCDTFHLASTETELYILRNDYATLESYHITSGKALKLIMMTEEEEKEHLERAKEFNGALLRDFIPGRPHRTIGGEFFDIE